MLPARTRRDVGRSGRHLLLAFGVFIEIIIQGREGGIVRGQEFARDEAHGGLLGGPPALGLGGAAVFFAGQVLAFAGDLDIGGEVGLVGGLGIAVAADEARAP